MTSANRHRLDASLVIPVHNKATITRQCLDALLAEPDDGISREIVVVDDGSSDRTPALLASYGDAIRVVRHETALGFASACNAGFAAARGEFVVLLNNDTIPTEGWLVALVRHARANPAAAVVGAKLLFPNETIQHAGVVFGLDREPHHLYAGLPADHPATATSRRFQAVTAACALFRRGPWQELGGLSTDFHNGWEDVDYCMRTGERGYEIHYCAESVLYHFESATRDLFSPRERANRALFAARWQEKIVPDDIGYYWVDGLLSADYGARYPIQLSVSPLLAGVTVGENVRLADRLLYDRARQVMILLRNNIVLNVRVQEAEARAADAERRLSEVLSGLAPSSPPAPEPEPIASSAPAADPPVAVAANDDPPAAEPSENPAPALPHRIVGMVEAPGRLTELVTDGVLIVSGWTLTVAGDATIEVLIDGASRGTVPYGDPRPDADALYPGYPAGPDCGFMTELPVADLADGMHDLTIRISTSQGDQAELSTTFEVDSRAYETGRVIGRIDQPVRGSLFVPREIVAVSGWALAPSGIRSIEAFIDGAPRGRLGYGALRPDIAKRRRQYADADHCGFSGVLPMFGLADGHHELLLVVTAHDGQRLEMPTRIVIDDAVTIDGGVPVLNRHYRAWRERQEAAAQPSNEIVPGENAVSFAIIVPLADACEDAVAALVASVQDQTYPGWRLTLVSSATTSEAVRGLAQRLATQDERVAFAEGGDRSFASGMNATLSNTPADWVAVLRPGVLLSPSALATVASALADQPEAVLVYTDDDRVDPESGERWNPFFKPDWSPDLLLAMNYLGPLVLFERDAALATGGLRDDLPGAEISDLALRVTDSSANVLHVPHVLASTIESAPGPGEAWHAANWTDADRQARQDALARRGINGQVEPGLHPGTWRVRYAMPEPPGVTAVIPTGGNLQLLRPCLEDLLERTDYPRLEILLVDNSNGEQVAALVAELAPRYPQLRRIEETRKPFNYSALINAALPHVTTPYLLMLNDDISVIEPDWLRAMMEHAQRPEVGIVGAKLLYPDDTIQHAGVILGPFGGSVHVFKRMQGDDPGYFDLPNVVRNCTAVTFACAVIDRTVFDTIGGLDADNLPVAFNDTDFCLRAREAGFAVIYTPHATLYHHESVTKTVIAHPHEIAFLRNRWGHVIDHDPSYNPNLTRQAEDARLRMEPSDAR
jgi:GT2 family glycosyltransferase